MKLKLQPIFYNQNTIKYFKIVKKFGFFLINFNKLKSIREIPKPQNTILLQIR